MTWTAATGYIHWGNKRNEHIMQALKMQSTMWYMSKYDVR